MSPAKRLAPRVVLVVGPEDFCERCKALGAAHEVVVICRRPELAVVAVTTWGPVTVVVLTGPAGRLEPGFEAAVDRARARLILLPDDQLPDWTLARLLVLGARQSGTIRKP